MLRPNQTINDFLRSSGMSVTTARQMVFTVLATAEEPLSMSDLTTLCQPLDRSSVYRTVGLFERLGIIIRIPAGWKYRIELSDQFRPHHHHAHCQKCGRSIELVAGEQLEKLLTRLADRNDFVMKSHQIEIEGVCRACCLSNTYV